MGPLRMPFRRSCLKYFTIHVRLPPARTTSSATERLESDEADVTPVGSSFLLTVDGIFDNERNHNNRKSLI